MISNFFPFKISNNYLNKFYSRWELSLQKRKISSKRNAK